MIRAPQDVRCSEETFSFDVIAVLRIKSHGLENENVLFIRVNVFLKFWFELHAQSLTRKVGHIASLFVYFPFSCQGGPSFY